MNRADGELILFWTLPVLAVIWISAFLIFPGFSPPMSPTMPAAAVADFYRDPQNLPWIRASMIGLNWFGFGLVPILMLIVLRIRRMTHHTPILSYSMMATAAGGPTLFLVADLFWLIAAFRPERDPELTQLLNDLAWITFTAGVPFLIGQSVLLALAIHLDRAPTPVFRPWVGHFNLVVAAALVPAAFTGFALDGPLAWDGLLSFWLKNAAIGAWIVVMATVLGRDLHRPRVAP